MICIYALINPIDDSIFYVGASMYPHTRLLQHCSSDFNTFKGEIICKILEQGKRPELLILEKVEYDQAAICEDFYVDLFKSFGFKLKQLRSNYKGKMLSTYQKKVMHLYAEQDHPE